jgi:guanylate kinase
MTMSNNQGEKQGLLIVLSGPSGVGKGTVCSALRQRMPELIYSISATTRKPREGEVDGVNYFFKSKDQFEHMIYHGDLLEWAEYVGNYYGTPAQFVKETIAAGKDIILEIEVQGALKVKQNFPEGVFVFLTPPSLSELKDRITKRGTETEESIRNRMEVGVEEIKLMEQYDYAVINDTIDQACKRIQAIVTAEHCKKERMIKQIKPWIVEVK